jgi:iodotyrosine deiodinase
MSSDRYKSYTSLELPDAVFEPLEFIRRPEPEMLERARSFQEEMHRRRTTRHFSTEPVPREMIELAIRTAGTAPSGAHHQPWRFVAVDDPEIKREMRVAAEAEEIKTYEGRMSDEWRRALAVLGTDHVKEHITDAPWVVVLFRESYGLTDEGVKYKHYYVDESVGIAAGFFIAAVHHMGLCTLTHTPTPMKFLRDLLRRPVNESAVLVLPVGYPATGAQVPRISRKAFEDIVQWNR